MIKKIYIFLERKINSLTEDEDLRQELWLYILEGNSPFTLNEFYQKLLLEQKKWH